MLKYLSIDAINMFGLEREREMSAMEVHVIIV